MAHTCNKTAIPLETDRLILRRFTPDDWEDLNEYLSQPETVRFEPYEPFSAEGSKREAVTRSENAAFLAVCLKNGGKLIGNIYIAPQEYGTWELGYVFNSKFWRSGYATEAARAAIEYAFANSARRVTAMCNPLNEASWKLLERLGFTREGHLRKNIFFKRNEQGEPLWQDTYEYAILEDKGMDAMTFDFGEIGSPEERARICGEVLRALPHWFGVEQSILDYIKKAKTHPFYAVFDGGTPIGFVLLCEHTPFAAEVSCMGIKQPYHRKGLGEKLIRWCEEYCKTRGIRFLTVKTLADLNPDESYAKTRAFYRAMGFVPIEVFLTLWDERNPCLFMIKAL